MEEVSKMTGNLMMATFSKQIELKEDEYLKNDIIYCKKCNTPRIAVLDNVYKVRCLCECQSEEVDKEIEENKKQEQIEKFERLQQGSILGKKYADTTFSNTDIDRSNSFLQAMARCQKYCEAYNECFKKGYGIYFYGACGVGKTHLMACMINDLNKKNMPCILTNFFEISKMIREAYENKQSDNNIISKLSTIPFLFIDDLGTESVQKNGQDAWLQDIVYDILNKRYNKNLPTIFSSNLTFDDLKKDKGLLPKTIDRIYEMTKNAVISITDDSYRKKEHKTKLPF